MEFNLLNDANKKMYYFEIEDRIAKIEYIKNLEKIEITHTEVPKELGGRGVASALINSVLEQIEKDNLKLVPLCPFVKGYLKKHPEWQKLLADQFQLD